MKKKIITISRQFGSGGRQIGIELQQMLNIPLYDKALFDEAAKRSGIHRDFFETAEKRNDRYFANVFQSHITPINMTLNDRMFLSQVETMQELAEQGPCIIVGRGANRILKNRDDVLNIFVYAQKEVRLKRIIEVYGVPSEKAEKHMNSIDKNRASYLKTYTDQTFGKAENYHLCIDSGTLGIEYAAKIIKEIYEMEMPPASGGGEF